MGKIEKNKEMTVHHRIVNITLVNFQVSSLDEQQKKLVDKSKAVFGISIKFSVEAKSRMVKIEAFFKIFSDDSKNQILLGEMDTIGIFEVLNMNEVIEKHEGKFPTSVLVLFTGILISTSRGFYIMRSANTYLEDIMLQPIDPNHIFRSHIEAAPNPK